MPMYLSIIEGKDIQGKPITKTYLADRFGKKIPNLPAREDDPLAVNKRAEIECHKDSLRRGEKLYTIEAKNGIEIKVPFELHAEQTEGTWAIAEEEYAEEQAIRDQVEKEVQEKLKKKTKVPA